MLDLESPRWNELTHAYGEAADIPPLLERLSTAPITADGQSEPWFSLWSALCHQSDVYTASYAAVPHVVAIAASKSSGERLEHINFIASVEAFRHRENSPSIPTDLEGDYLSSLKQATNLILDSLVAEWDESGYKVLLGALAVLRGEYKLGTAIFELEEEMECAECGTILSTRGYDWFDEI